MQTPGTYISAVGHVGLIGWLLLGWGMQSQPLPMQAMDVSIMSGEEFDQMMAARTPDPGDAPPTAPVQPVIEDASPPPPAVEAPAEPAPAPEPVAPPVAETPPPAAPEPPVTDVTDQAPTEPTPPETPPPAPDLPPSPDPTQAPSNRIASTPTAPPPADAQISDIAREAVIPDETAPAEVAIPEQQATAPEQTATEIVIADERPRGAVETSLRPISRPARPVPPAPEPQQTATAEPAPTPTPTPAPTPEPAPTPTPAPAPDTRDAVADALAAAVAGSSAPAVQAGPPMTGSERDSFRIAVNSCWNVDPGSVAARVTVEVGFNLSREGRVEGEPRLLSSNGDQSATSTAFEAARRAILRCERGGYQLPADKYDQWREVVITFDPSGMRLR